MDTTPTNTGAGTTAVLAPCLDVFESLEPRALVERFRAGIQALDPRVLDMDDEQIDRWFSDEDGVGAWSCRALLTHLMDTEILFVSRLRRILVEDGPVFENWDEHAFIDSRLSKPGETSLLMPSGALVAALHTLRQTLSTVLVQLNETDWDRRAMSPSYGEINFLKILQYATWHLEHHSAFLNAKVNHVLGPAAEADESGEQWGGCGEGCACASKAEGAARDEQDV